jgi:hypothetical protein
MAEDCLAVNTVQSRTSFSQLKRPLHVLGHGGSAVKQHIGQERVRGRVIQNRRVSPGLRCIKVTIGGNAPKRAMDTGSRHREHTFRRKSVFEQSIKNENMRFRFEPCLETAIPSTATVMSPADAAKLEEISVARQVRTVCRSFSNA